MNAPTTIGKTCPFNIFDLVLEQIETRESLWPYPLVCYLPHKYYHQNSLWTAQDDLRNYRATCAKYLVLKKTIVDFTNLIDIGKKTLGVHIRLTDMNLDHPQFGVFSFNDYKSKIDEVLFRENIDKIFVASDNNESLLKMKNIYGEDRIINIDAMLTRKTVILLVQQLCLILIFIHKLCANAFYCLSAP